MVLYGRRSMGLKIDASQLGIGIRHVVVWAQKEYSNSMASSGKATVTITLGELQIWLSQDGAYPDQISDLCNRASVLLGTALMQIKATGINVMSPDGEDDEDIDEDEDA